MAILARLFGNTGTASPGGPGGTVSSPVRTPTPGGASGTPIIQGGIGNSGGAIGTPIASKPLGGDGGASGGASSFPIISRLFGNTGASGGPVKGTPVTGGGGAQSGGGGAGANPIKNPVSPSGGTTTWGDNPGFHHIAQYVPVSGIAHMPNVDTFLRNPSNLFHPQPPTAMPYDTESLQGQSLVANATGGLRNLFRPITQVFHSARADNAATGPA